MLFRLAYNVGLQSKDNAMKDLKEKIILAYYWLREWFDVFRGRGWDK
jgi:hypothetical protein